MCSISSSLSLNSQPAGVSASFMSRRRRENSRSNDCLSFTALYLAIGSCAI